eukprot:11131830-Lingulodinium_polyedra.AAC.1
MIMCLFVPMHATSRAPLGILIHAIVAARAHFALLLVGASLYDAVLVRIAVLGHDILQPLAVEGAVAVTSVPLAVIA